MTKVEFKANYKDLITLYFNFEELIANPTITIRETTKDLHEFLEFYIPRYTKYGHYDDRHIRQIMHDNDSTIVQLKEVIASPADWDLQPFPSAEALSKKLWPIPVATDTQSGKTLILDSNHTACTLLAAGINMKVQCVELVGENLSRLGTDLLLMQ